MPDVYELDKSRKVKLGQNAELQFICIGTYDDDVARAALAAEFPDSFLDMFYVDADIEPVGGDVWKATVQYSASSNEPLPGADPPGGGGESGESGGTSPPPPPAPGPTDPLGTAYSFDISGVDEKITQSKETLDRVGRNDRDLPDTKGAIGVQEDGEIKGCERISPKMELSITKSFSYITAGYVNRLAELVGKTNNAIFYGYDPGEVLLIGASGGTKDNQTLRADVTFKLSISKNENNITIIPGELGGIIKGGHDYLWVLYESIPSNGKITQQPYGAIVERIYDSDNFGDLGIGT